MKNKKLKIALATTSSFAILGLSAFALFTARDDSNWIARAGTVDIEVEALSLTNSDNVNPGDNDPTNPKDSESTTGHVFEYMVSNLGTKSVRTRHTIILTATDGEKHELLDARYLALFKGGKELVAKTYILDDDSEVTDIKNLKEGQVVKAVKYVFMGDVFDGFGDDLTKGGNAEKESLDGVVKQAENAKSVDKVYSYDFALLRGADNDYQNADFVLDVVIEAMQYRNTEESDWNTVSTVSKKFSSADVAQDYVPARDEDSEGNKLSSEFLDNQD